MKDKLEKLFGDKGYFTRDHSISRSTLIISSALFLLLVVSYSS